MATCRLLPAGRVAELLGATVARGATDLRTNTPDATQLDGCVYAGSSDAGSSGSGSTGTQVGYLVWRLAAKGSRATVEKSLPPPESGAVHFDPGIGELSAGAVLSNGPIVLTQVNAIAAGRLVQVTVRATAAAPVASVRVIAAAAAMDLVRSG